ncbi:hypothetical protein F2Q69_00042027 [Brassica cretica]|uniref:Amidohydrolase-related domain-containing protein n=1 Tax=Brassica cretica TaxID=69181 RepID=A0A8S9NQR1_BRACR|nr:hypothetical protein F2Q69_00042027 [Brassica cretica]
MERSLLQWRLLPLLALIASFLSVFFASRSYEKETQCSLLPHDHYWISSKRILTPDGLISGSVEVNGGVIVSVVKEEDWYKEQRSRVKVTDYGEAVIMPGLVDVHAHLDDPGRSEWEGFPSGTKAAAAGGITTLIDMPLNSDPSTVSPETLKLKIEAAKKRILVDVGFWGGLVPDNALNSSALSSLLDAGVLGLTWRLVVASYKYSLLNGITKFGFTTLV